MNQFMALTRVNVSMALYQMSLMRRRTGNREGRGFQFGLIGIAVFIMVYMGFMATLMGRVFNPLGYVWILLALGMLVIDAIIFGLGLYTFNSLLFESNDTDQLFAYPISKFSVVAGKVMGLVVENWMLSFVVWLPMVAVYSYYAHPGVLFYLFAIVVWLIAPGIPMAVLGLISYVVGVASSGPRMRKVLQIVLTVGAVAGLAFGVRGAINHSIQTAKLNGDAFAQLRQMYPPIGDAATALAKGDWGAMGLAVLWNVVPFLVLCALIATSYTWIRSRITTTARVTTGRVTYARTSTARALYGKELGRLLGSSMYLLQSVVGAAMVILFAFLFSIKTGKNAQGMQALLAQLHISITPIMLIFFLFCLSIANTTAPSISLEGKNLWIVQSLPVDAAQVLRAKLLVQLTIITPLAIIGCFISIFTVHVGGLGFVQLVVPCVLFTLVSACVGLIANLYYHRFDFYNDMQVAKNSASVLMTYGVMILTMAVATVGYWAWSRYIGHVNFWIYWGVWCAVLAVATVVLYRYLMTRGVVLFRAISD